MKRNLIPYMPADQVRLCNANNDCIEARGDNARFIVLAVVTVLLAAGECCKKCVSLKFCNFKTNTYGNERQTVI